MSLDAIGRALVCAFLLAASGACNAQQRQQIDVLTPAEAGKLFLTNAGDFDDENAKTSNALAGRTITADFADGDYRIRHEFSANGNTMTWKVLSGVEANRKGSASYQAFDLRPGITLVMMRPTSDESVVVVFDDNRGLAMGFLGRRDTDPEDKPLSLLPLVGAIIEAGTVQPAANVKLSNGLAGSRFTVVYPNEVAIYEHIYLNLHYVTWLGLAGTSAGVADTERYFAFEIAPHLFLAAWNERSAPLQISFLFDFKNRTELAAIFGYDESKDRVVYQTTSSSITEITHTQIAGLND